MRLAVGCDPAGFELKCSLLAVLKSKSYELVDVGCYSLEPADYPLLAEKVAAKVAAGECERGVLICGTGQGMVMSANKLRGIRASLCHSEFAAVMSREHNDANVLCMGAWVVTPAEAMRIVDIWLFAKFSGGEVHRNRITMIDRLAETGA